MNVYSCGIISTSLTMGGNWACYLDWGLIHVDSPQVYVGLDVVLNAYRTF